MAGPTDAAEGDDDDHLYSDDKLDEYYSLCEREAEQHAMATHKLRTSEVLTSSRVERERAAGRPPHREEAKYGPRGDAAGDTLFRKDREQWYERFTGRSITGVTLQMQNELCDAIARRFREYSDGRAGRSSD